MKTKADYDALQADLAALEKKLGPTDCHATHYLADENIDRENVEMNESDDGFWHAMYSAACMAAGARGEEYGLDVNALLGRTIY